MSEWTHKSMQRALADAAWDTNKLALVEHHIPADIGHGSFIDILIDDPCVVIEVKSECTRRAVDFGVRQLARYVRRLGRPARTWLVCPSVPLDVIRWAIPPTVRLLTINEAILEVEWLERLGPISAFEVHSRRQVAA